MTCDCGKVSFEVEGGRVILKADDTVVIATVSQDGGFVKVEHLTCQTCMTVRTEAPVGSG